LIITRYLLTMNKIKFFFLKPEVVVITGQRRKQAKEIILRVLDQHFKDVLVLETDKTENLSFFARHSKLPILVDDEKIRVQDEILSFGFDEKKDVFASDVKVNGGINFKVNYKGSFVPFWTASSDNNNYQEQIFPILAAVCVGTALDLNLVEISQSLNVES